MVAASSATVGAPLVLAACGGADELEERSGANDPDLLNAILAQHLAVEEAAGQINDTVEPAVSAAAGLIRVRTDSIALLEGFIAEQDATATTEPTELTEAESPPEGLALQLQDSIDTSLEAIGSLSAAAYRQAVHHFITEDAAALAAVRSVLGGEIVPDAFVFGAPATQEDGG